MRALHIVISVVLVLAASGTSSAQEREQTVPKDAAAAEVLFREARDQFNAGHYDEACPKLEESLRLDPAIGTMWYLARCYQETGRTASAWGMFLEVAAEARRLNRPQQELAAKRRAAILEPQLCRLRLEVAATPLDEVTIKVNGRLRARASWATPVPLDCGKHTVEVSYEGAVERHQVEVSNPGSVTTKEVLMPRAPVKKKQGLAANKSATGPRWYGDWVGWSLVGAGLGSGALGLVLLQQANDFEDDARTPGLDLLARDRLFDDADNRRLIAVLAGSAGAALVVGGAVKLVLHDDSEGVVIAPTNGGAKASYRFRF